MKNETKYKFNDKNSLIFETIENKEKSFIRNALFENYKKPTYELRRCLKRIANQRSVSQAQVAINWCCYQGAIPLVGMRKKSQVIDVSNVFNWNLKKSEFKVLQELSKKCLKKIYKLLLDIVSSSFCNSTIISFVRKNGIVNGGLYRASCQVPV